MYVVTPGPRPRDIPAYESIEVCYQWIVCASYRRYWLPARPIFCETNNAGWREMCQSGPVHNHLYRRPGHM